jgi:hypothetical protein
MTDDPLIHAMALAKSRLEELTQRVQELEEALRFYADALNYVERDSRLHPGGYALGVIPVEQDQGKRARSVLNKETNRG